MQPQPLDKSRFALATATLGGQIVAMFLTWFTTGSRGRSSFEVLDAAIIFSPSYNNVAAMIEAVWLMLPAVAIASLCLWLAGLAKVGRRVVAACITILGITGLVVLLFSGIQVGPAICLALFLTYTAAITALRSRR